MSTVFKNNFKIQSIHILIYNFSSAFCSKDGSYSEEGSEAEARRER